MVPRNILPLEFLLKGLIFLGVNNMKRKLIIELKNYVNEKVCIQGWIYKIRKLKSIILLKLLKKEQKEEQKFLK